ncbi:hypothetical protein [Streptococcus orisasini]|uniref:hypothetical protein n=1 Tax=Streptococcus orisasini TaxID=1080071 RepID=UPI00070FF360|nr:hypothetical protein [Streptococcus orisasini]
MNANELDKGYFRRDESVGNGEFKPILTLGNFETVAQSLGMEFPRKSLPSDITQGSIKEKGLFLQAKTKQNPCFVFNVISH